MPLSATGVWLRVECDFLSEEAWFSYSLDGASCTPLGAAVAMVFQVKTFQGVRYALFHYTTGDAPGGYADFGRFSVDEPHPCGLRQPIPVGRRVRLAPFGAGSVLAVQDGVVTAVSAGDPLASSTAAQFTVVDRGLGRIALQVGRAYVSVRAPGGSGAVTVRAGEPTAAETFQWTETPYGDLMLLSLATHRHLRAEPDSGAVSAGHPGPSSDRRDGSCFSWQADEENDPR